MSSELFAGYQTYAQNNGLPDPEKLGDSFAAYLNTADGQQRIAAGLSNVMNVDAVQQQMMTAIQQYMQQAMTQMGNKLQSAMASGMQVDEEAFLNAFQINMNEDELTELLNTDWEEFGGNTKPEDQNWSVENKPYKKKEQALCLDLPPFTARIFKVKSVKHSAQKKTPKK